MKKPYRLYKRPNGIYYYKLADGRWKSTGLRNKRKAEHFAHQAYEKHRGNPDVLTLRDFAGSFFESNECSWVKRQRAKGQSLSDAHLQARRGQLLNHILPRWGDYPLTELRGVMIEEWLIDLPLENQTCNHILAAFNVILNDAVAHGYLREKPVASLKRFANRHRERDPLTIADLRKLFPADEQQLLTVWREYRYAAMTLLAATTGMRSGEIRALTWDDWNRDSGIVQIHRAVKPDMTVGETKTGKTGYAVVVPAAAEMLDRYLETTFYDAPTDLMFPNEHGGVMDKRVANANFKAALSRAGVVTAGRNLVFHSLRHTFATLSAQHVPDDVIQAATQHTNIRTLKRYTHVQDAMRRQRLLGHRDSVNAIWQPLVDEEADAS